VLQGLREIACTPATPQRCDRELLEQEGANIVQNTESRHGEAGVTGHHSEETMPSSQKESAINKIATKKGKLYAEEGTIKGPKEGTMGRL